MTTGTTKQKRQQRVLDFVQSQVIRNGKAVAKFGDQAISIRQPATADMSETLASLVSDVAGRGHRTWNTDLSDGSEVKAATNIYTLCRYPKWVFNFPTDQHIKRYHKAPRIFMIEYYEAAGRKVVDVYVVSGQDKVFRQAINDWKNGGYASDKFCLLTPMGSGVARHGVGNFRLPLVCRVAENEQGRAEILHWTVEECMAATSLIQTEGVDALSDKQKEKFLCKKVK